MRGVIEKQRDRLRFLHHLERLDLIIRRRIRAHADEITVTESVGELDRPVFLRDRLFDNPVNLLRQPAAVFEVLRDDLNRRLMIVRRQQNQVFGRYSQFPLAALAQNGRGDVEAIEIVGDKNDAPPAIVQRETARMDGMIRRDGRGLPSIGGADKRAIGRDVHFRRTCFHLVGSGLGCHLRRHLRGEQRSAAHGLQD